VLLASGPKNPDQTKFNLKKLNFHTLLKNKIFLIMILRAELLQLFQISLLTFKRFQVPLLSPFLHTLNLNIQTGTASIKQYHISLDENEWHSAWVNFKDMDSNHVRGLQSIDLSEAKGSYV